MQMEERVGASLHVSITTDREITSKSPFGIIESSKDERLHRLHTHVAEHGGTGSPWSAYESFGAAGEIKD